jgi:hypothetical protein
MVRSTGQTDMLGGRWAAELSRGEQGGHIHYTHKGAMRMTAGSHKNVVFKCAESLGIDPVLCELIRIGHSCLDVFSSASRWKN